MSPNSTAASPLRRRSSSRRGSSIFPALLAVVGLVQVSCHDITFDDPSLLTLSVDVSRDSLVPGDTARITVTATNATGRTIRIQRSCGERLGIGIYRNGERIEPIGYPVCPAEDRHPQRFGFAPGEFVFPPGEGMRLDAVWTARTGYPPSGLAPDTYHIVGELYAGGTLTPSPPVPVEVLPMLAVDVEAAPAVVTAGDTVEVRVAVTNRSNRSVEVPAFPSCYFAVWQQQDEGTPRHVAGCDHALSIVTLATDETFTGTAPWRPGEPGEYQLLVRLVWDEQAGPHEWLIPLRVQ